MGKLDRRRRGLVQQAKHRKAGRLRGFFGQKALVAVGVGGNAEHHLEPCLLRSASSPRFECSSSCAFSAIIISAINVRSGIG